MLGTDLPYVLRSLRRAPGYAITVMLVLGLGIGANTAIFSVLRAVMLKALPHRDGERLVYLRQSIVGVGGENIRFSVPEIQDLRTDASALTGVAEYSGVPLTLDQRGETFRLSAGLVTGNYFEVMGLSPAFGRGLSSMDDGTGVPPVAVLTHDFWRQHFQSDSSIVGTTVRIEGKPVQIVGVLEPAPTFPEKMHVLMNMVISEHHTSATMVHGRTHRMTDMIARLAPGVSLEVARSEISTIRQRVQAEHPEAYDPGSVFRVDVLPLREVMGERARLTMWLLMGASGVVLLIAAANVANLTLVRAVRRQPELMVRVALGARAGRIRRILLLENLTLAGLGALLGLAIAIASIGPLTRFAARFSPRATETTLDLPILLFALGLAGAVGVVLAFVPRLGAEVGGNGGGLASSRATADRTRRRVLGALVAGQVAISVVLLAAAGLLLKSADALSRVDPGLRAARTLTMEVPATGDGRTHAQLRSLHDRISERLAALPGVESVGYGSVVPLRHEAFQLDLRAEARPLASGEPQPRAELRSASPDYFRAAGIPLLSGRWFLDTDRDSAARVVVLNESLAKSLFGTRDPLGQRVAWTGELLRFIGVSDEWRTVVGVVANTRDGGLDALPRHVVFEPVAQEIVWAAGFVLRTHSDPRTIQRLALEVVRELAPQDAVQRVMTLEEIADESVAPRRANALLVLSFGSLALLIAAVGVAAMLSFSASARTQEIGIRMALGAPRASVVRMIMEEGALWVLAGVSVGLLLSMAVSRLVRGLLFAVSPADPAVLALAGGVMGVLGLIACCFPATMASSVDPARTVRSA